MKKDKIQHLVLGTIAVNCWIIPLDDITPPGVSSGTSPEGSASLGNCAIVDPGEQGDLIIARLSKLRLRPKYILLTHGHFDHTAALPDLAAAFGSAVEIAIHRDDAHYLGPDSYQIHRETFDVGGNTGYIKRYWRPLPSPTRLLSEGDTIGPFTLLHLPGHTPGSAGFFLEKEKCIFSGDTLFKAGIGRTDLPGGNFYRLQQSLRRLFTLKPDVTVYPGHGPLTSIGDEWIDMA
ncbi:MAG: MBL fold metallo-hydrolase [Spirochaetaceae bacterium]|jgi:glyoxylase-like metal-dependent hydrolase (beta-lactamase superfamily II)|nr:MBL fold metallo-hydrolase [Spirochaetaceae bacterium]